jgi:predicted DNA-binding protein
MKKKTKHLSIRLTNQQYQKLIDMLKTEGLTKSELVRLALTDYMTKE